ncbi:MAG: alkaline phosphatase family protein [Deltaproteobacteria bacterium]|uniref:Alkaline phosphatase family protein n=1 Tax=Candidatus Zymogenus saltonus TaxID=2844893 RepID=A0A9D8PM70_9DELT|nr:alkaline phosphatase family protein [Candidatus Zymogenus saltonus]
MEDRKVVIIGLDCLEPTLVERWIDDLPNLKRIMEEGIYGKIRSTDPPITIPAWSAMMSGYSPGSLGLYGFRNRGDFSYDALKLATSRTVKKKRVWDILSDRGKKVVLLGVPQTYPPNRVNGQMVSGWLTPDTSAQYTYPTSLKSELVDVFGEYIIDVKDFRTDDKERLLREIYAFSNQHFDIAEYMITKKNWDFFMMVDMGPDRFHHGFWKFFDTTHPKHVPGNELSDCVREYYIFLDGRLGRLLKKVPEESVIVVVSDHGAQPMMGGVAINEWLIDKGYLAVKDYPKELTPIRKIEIDWEKTKAWGEGGYYCRIFVNVKGREPKGVVDPGDYDDFLNEIIDEISNMKDESGNLIGNVCFRPGDLYREVNGIPPDIFVYLGNLRYRSVGSLGVGGYITYDNDTGPDDANHSFYGFFAMSGTESRGVRDGISIVDVAPTVLSLFGIDAPDDIEGKAIK